MGPKGTKDTTATQQGLLEPNIRGDTMEPHRVHGDTAKPGGTKESKGLKHCLHVSVLGKGNLQGGSLGWHTLKEGVCL